MTATEIRVRLDEFDRSEAMGRLRQSMENMIRQTIEAVCLTPIQFRFPRSKKKRIRKKWRKDPGNFRRLMGDQQRWNGSSQLFSNSEIGRVEKVRFIERGGQL